MIIGVEIATATPRKTCRSWTPGQEARLCELAATGASLLRACAAVGRPAGTVKQKAAALGLSFPGVRKVRAGLREAGALETRCK